MISKVKKFFDDFSDYPENYIKDNKIKTFIRQSKITIHDAIYYRLRYSFASASNTLQSITSFINMKNLENQTNYECFTRGGIYKKDKILPADLYKSMFNKIKKFYKENFSDYENSIILVDGVYSNTNVLHNGRVETSMSLGFYDNCNNMPIDIHFTDTGKIMSDKLL